MSYKILLFYDVVLGAIKSSYFEIVILKHVLASFANIKYITCDNKLNNNLHVVFQIM